MSRLPDRLARLAGMAACVAGFARTALPGQLPAPRFVAPAVGHQVRTKTSHPAQRRHVVGVYDEARDWFVVCGGFGDEGFLNDVWAFDLGREKWINITPGPQPRLDHLAIYDPRRESLLLYGGDAHRATKFHDLWELRVHPGVSADSLR